MFGLGYHGPMIERLPRSKQRRAARNRRQEQRWAAKAGEVRVITAADLPADSKLRT